MEKDADIIAGDFNSSACRDRGKAGVSSIEETWEKTLLIPPPDVVPMWGQGKESGDCCSFTTTMKSEPSWRVARHGSFQLNRNKMQMEERDQAAHLLVYIHICEAQTVERSIRSETAKSYRKQPEKIDAVKKKKETSLTLAAPPGQGRGPPDPPWPSPCSSPEPRRSACRLFFSTPPNRPPPCPCRP